METVAARFRRRVLVKHRDRSRAAFTFQPEPSVAAQILCDWPGWWCNPDKDQLVQALARESDVKKRQAIIEKNQFWFDYWRPMNWAFLHGDRTEQPSSRDHRNPNIRWFPQELEKFQALIQQKEGEIAARVENLR